jgi:RHS repeat-associated protein
MSASTQKTVLCRYHYDPLDRLADHTAPSTQQGVQRFYCKDRLTTEIQAAIATCVFQHDNHLLAQKRSRQGQLATTLLATDMQQSVLTACDVVRPAHFGYTPYGHRQAENGLLSLLGFNGERWDSLTGHYLLGNGYRAFNPVLMRFNSPDSWSPFNVGGLNAYAYGLGDPVSTRDPSGHAVVRTLLTTLARPAFRNFSIGVTAVGGVAALASMFIEDEGAKAILGVVSLAGVAVGGVGIIANLSAKPASRSLSRNFPNWTREQNGLPPSYWNSNPPRLDGSFTPPLYSKGPRNHLADFDFHNPTIDQPPKYSAIGSDELLESARPLQNNIQRQTGKTPIVLPDTRSVKLLVPNSKLLHSNARLSGQIRQS